MKLVSSCVVALSLTGLLLACSSDDSSSSGGSACKPANGTYKIKYTKDSSSTPTCAEIPEQTTTISDSSGDAGTGTPSTGCTSSTSGCTSTYSCTQSQAGITSESSGSTTTSSSGATGTMQTKTSGAGAADSTCKYSFTWTKA